VRLVVALAVKLPLEAVSVIGYVPGASVVAVVNSTVTVLELPPVIGVGIAVEPGGIPVTLISSPTVKNPLLVTRKLKVTVAPGAAVCGPLAVTVILSITTVTATCALCTRPPLVPVIVTV
jgi:hypothetical protein